MDDQFNDNIEELPRCTWEVDGKPCGAYAPIGWDVCRDHWYDAYSDHAHDEDHSYCYQYPREE